MQRHTTLGNPALHGAHMFAHESCNRFPRTQSAPLLGILESRIHGNPDVKDYLEVLVCRRKSVNSTFRLLTKPGLDGKVAKLDIGGSGNLFVGWLTLKRNSMRRDGGGSVSAQHRYRPNCGRMAICRRWRRASARARFAFGLRKARIIFAKACQPFSGRVPGRFSAGESDPAKEHRSDNTNGAMQLLAALVVN